MASAAELLVSCAKALLARRETWLTRNGCVLMPRFENSDEPEMLAVAGIPSAEERRRRELMLARLLVIALEMLLSEGYIDLAIKIETAMDIMREFKHAYP